MGLRFANLERKLGEIDRARVFINRFIEFIIKFNKLLIY
jgi:hypothetical protein